MSRAISLLSVLLAALAGVGSAVAQVLKVERDGFWEFHAGREGLGPAACAMLTASPGGDALAVRYVEGDRLPTLTILSPGLALAAGPVVMRLSSPGGGVVLTALAGASQLVAPLRPAEIEALGKVLSPGLPVVVRLEGAATGQWVIETRGAQRMAELFGGCVADLLATPADPSPPPPGKREPSPKPSSPRGGDRTFRT